MKCSEQTQSGKQCNAYVGPGQTMCNSHRRRDGIELRARMDFALCSECAFFYVNECRRYPPRDQPYDGEIKSFWPNCTPDDWCGEYREKGIR